MRWAARVADVRARPCRAGTGALRQAGGGAGQRASHYSARGAVIAPRSVPPVAIAPAGRTATSARAVGYGTTPRVSAARMFPSRSQVGRRLPPSRPTFQADAHAVRLAPLGRDGRRRRRTAGLPLRPRCSRCAEFSGTWRCAAGPARNRGRPLPQWGLGHPFALGTGALLLAAAPTGPASASIRALRSPRASRCPRRGTPSDHPWFAPPRVSRTGCGYGRRSAVLGLRLCGLRCTTGRYMTCRPGGSPPLHLLARRLPSQRPGPAHITPSCAVPGAALPPRSRPHLSRQMRAD